MQLTYSTEVSLFFSIIPGNVDAFVPNWHEFKKSCCGRNRALKFATVHLQPFLFPHIVECTRLGQRNHSARRCAEQQWTFSQNERITLHAVMTSHFRKFYVQQNLTYSTFLTYLRYVFTDLLWRKYIMYSWHQTVITVLMNLILLNS